jgi:uncharacterized protein (DUF3084 family)
MSSIGKIFVVVNLALALLLLGSLGSLLNASRDTKDDVARLESELADAQAGFAQAESEFNTRTRLLDGEKNNLQNENQDLTDARDAAQRGADSEAVDNQQLRDDLSKLTGSLDLLQQDLSSVQTRNRELQASNDDYRTRTQDAQEGETSAELARRDLEERISGFQNQIAMLDNELTDAMDSNRRAQAEIDVARSAGYDSSAIIAPNAVTAMVAQVDQEYGFVILDKGSADGVEKGITLDVVRGGDYLGQVRVDDVQEKYCTAIIVLAKAPMQARDMATTRL